MTDTSKRKQPIPPHGGTAPTPPGPGQHHAPPLIRGHYSASDAVQFYPQYPQQQVAPKSPGLALIASFFIPGLGSMVAGRVGMGILILSLYILSLLALFIIIGFITLPLVWAWGMYDGYHGAKAWNTAHGILS